MTLVVDASVALTWCFDDEQRSETDDIGRRVVAETAVVPGLFYIELANILIVGERRGRLTPAQSDQRLARIAQMPFVIDEETPLRVWSATVDLARSSSLTMYDATYLELAIRLGAELATLDRALIAAARSRGVPVLP